MSDMRTVWIGGLAASLLIFAGCRSLSGMRRIELKESSAPLVNPGKGWIIYGADVSSFPQPEVAKDLFAKMDEAHECNEQFLLPFEQEFL